LFPIIIAAPASSSSQTVTFDNVIFRNNNQLNDPNAGLGVVNILTDNNKVIFNNCTFFNNVYSGREGAKTVSEPTSDSTELYHAATSPLLHILCLVRSLTYLLACSNAHMYCNL
jgi:hypothetical protein